MADEDLTSEQLQGGAAVAGAAVEAAAAEPTPAKARAAAKRAAQTTAKEQRIPLTEEEADMIAEALVQKIDQRGGFDSSPEPVTAPPAPVAAGGEPVEQQQPRSTSFAERFRSL
jgi:hypothetical protein